MKFSILIPAYKAIYLEECISSCIKQTYSNFELIIVNDASPENIDSVISKFSDPRIKYYRNEVNCGAVNVVDNWNMCLSYATGDYVICMGDDDRLSPICLDEYNKLVSAYPGLSVYHAWTELIDDNSDVFNMQEPRPVFESALCMLWNRWKGRIQFIGDFCFDTMKLKEEGGFYKLPLAWASDDITAFRAAFYGGIANTQVPCFQYRVSRLTISNGNNNKLKSQSILLEKQWYKALLSSLKIDTLNSIDRVYYSLIKQEFEHHFCLKIKYHMLLDLKCSIANVLYWLNNRKSYGLSFKDCIVTFVKVILK